MSVASDLVEAPLCGKDNDIADCNSVDVFNRPVISSVYENASFPRGFDSIDILLPVSGDNASGECDWDD